MYIFTLVSPLYGTIYFSCLIMCLNEKSKWELKSWILFPKIYWSASVSRTVHSKMKHVVYTLSIVGLVNIFLLYLFIYLFIYYFLYFSNAHKGWIYLMKNTVKAVILWNILTIFYCSKFKCNLFSWIFNIITPVFSVTWSSRNHSNIQYIFF